MSATRPAPRLADALFLLALVLIAAVPLWPVYEHPQLVVTAVVAAVAGVALAVAAALWRLPGYAVAVATAAVYLAAGVPVAFPGLALSGVLPTLEGLGQLVPATAWSWKKALSVAPPLGEADGLLVPVLVVVLAASAWGGVVVFRSRRPAMALGAPVLVYVFAILYGGREPAWPAETAAALVSAGLLWVVCGIGRRSGRGVVAGPGAPGRRAARAPVLPRVLGAVPLIALCAAGGVGLSAIAPSPGHRVVAREAVRPPFDPHEEVSPLIGFRNSVLPPDRDRPMLRVSGLPSGARLRLASLDDYNGLVFAVGDDPAGATGVYERVPVRVARRSPQGAAAVVHVTVEGQRGVWLPTVGGLDSIRFTGAGVSRGDDFFYNTSASTAVLAEGMTAGLRYTLHTHVATGPDAGAIRRLRPGSARQRHADAIPEAISEAVASHGGRGSAGTRLAALAAWLRSGYVSDSGPGEPISRPGHSRDRLTSLVTAVPMLGDAEQYAPAFALMARELGFPSRVVVGYAPQTKPGGAELIVTGADLTAWVEVQDASGRWFPIDPNPPERTVPREQRTSQELVARPLTVPPPPPPVTHDTRSARRGDDRAPESPVEEPWWPAAIGTVCAVGGVVVAVAAVVLAPLWVTLLLRLLIARRRRRRDAERRVLTGAWEEMVDRLVESGVDVPASATRREVAAIAGVDAVRRLADRADRAVFDVGHVTPGDVEAYWSDLRTATAALHDGDSRSDRLRALLSWRALRARLPGLRLVPQVTGRAGGAARGGAARRTRSRRRSRRGASR